MSTWQDIASAPRDALHNAIVLAKLWQPTHEDGEPDGPMQVAWAHVAYRTASGWQVGTGGFKGVHGFASFALHDATHWVRLPQTTPQSEREGR